ncbi:PLDc N-terminal domain-containing protein [Propioniciclava sinopodophylli]|uniref:PLDc N-terminal domain-containing protein n=1 Tax=Propioniciclava sinopodophylli TaxID=1837344 RepID=UPI00248FD04B|nr:PLDc N-terminal domain-containing protein [Propioniciclava sinopodophylli]
MPRVLLIIAIVAVTVYALVEAAQAHPSRVRAMPRWLWFVAIVALPVLGPVGWFAIGRPPTPTRHPPLAPDDDPDFLRGL